MTLIYPSLGKMPIRLIGVVGDGELLVIARKHGMRPYSPILRKSIAAQRNDRYTGGLTQPGGCGTPSAAQPHPQGTNLRAHHRCARETNKFISSHKPANLEFGGAELARPFVKFEVV